MNNPAASCGVSNTQPKKRFVASHGELIPKRLNVEVGGALELDVAGGMLTARPVMANKPRRYSLKELLRGATPRNLAALRQQTKGVLDGAPIGRELT